MKTIEALNDHIIVDVLPQGEETTEGGIVIPDTSNTAKPQAYGYVLSVGPKVVSPIKPTDVVVFHKNGGQVIMNGSKILRVLKEPEIYGKLIEAD